MSGDGMVDQFVDLFGFDPAVRVKDKIHHALFLDRNIKSQFQIANGVRIVGLLQMIG